MFSFYHSFLPFYPYKDQSRGKMDIPAVSFMEFDNSFILAFVDFIPLCGLIYEDIFFILLLLSQRLNLASLLLYYRTFMAIVQKNSTLESPVHAFKVKLKHALSLHGKESTNFPPVSKCRKNIPQIEFLFFKNYHFFEQMPMLELSWTLLSWSLHVKVQSLNFHLLLLSLPLKLRTSFIITFFTLILYLEMLSRFLLGEI